MVGNSGNSGYEFEDIFHGVFSVAIRLSLTLFAYLKLSKTRS